MAIAGFLAEAASGGDLLAARQQMALSLGWHIVVASFGVAFPIFILLAEWRGTRGDEDAMELARRWSKTFAVLFAVGAVSGTILSFELGMLWPGMVGTFQAAVVLGLSLFAPREAVDTRGHAYANVLWLAQIGQTTLLGVTFMFSRHIKLDRIFRAPREVEQELEQEEAEYAAEEGRRRG